MDELSRNDYIEEIAEEIVVEVGCFVVYVNDEDISRKRFSFKTPSL